MKKKAKAEKKKSLGFGNRCNIMGITRFKINAKMGLRGKKVFGALSVCLSKNFFFLFLNKQ